MIETVSREHQPNFKKVTGTTIGICPMLDSVEIEVYNDDNISFPCHAYASPENTRELALDLIRAAATVEKSDVLPLVDWQMCDKPLGYHEEDGKETENEYWRKGDPFYALPDEDGEYLVTMRNGNVLILEYDCECGFDGAAPCDDVIAWAYLPTPAKPMEQEDA